MLAAENSETVYNGVDYSSVYDFNYYSSRYPDVKQAFGDDNAAAIAHFVNSGMTEGRQGSESFEVQSYRNRYADLRQAFGGNLKAYYLHYMSFGKAEGRTATGDTTPVGITVYRGTDYSAVYDYNYYISNHADVKQLFGNDDVAAIANFVNSGMSEGRQGSAGFDLQSYRNRYADLSQAFGGDLKAYYLHYMAFGKAEGRTATGDTTPIGITVYQGTDYSAVYDYNYYISKHADVKQLFGNDDVAAIANFVNSGMSEGRQGSAGFDLQSYRNRYADLSQVFGTNLKAYYLHYMAFGKAEGRTATGDTTPIGITVYRGTDYSAVYDYNYYISKHADVKQLFGNDDMAAIAHFVNSGMSEGWQGSAGFDVQSYRNRYEDLRQAYGDDLEAYYLHYMAFGIAEGRTATGEMPPVGIMAYKGVDYSAVYDYNYYISKYADVKQLFGNDYVAAIVHFINNGMSEGRQGSASFDVQSYRNRYADLRQAFGTNLKAYYLHYMAYGKAEGRTATGDTTPVGTTMYQGIDYSAVYDYNYYISNYADVKQAFGNDDMAAIAHFVNSGISEGRQGSENFNVQSYRSRYQDLQAAYGNNLKAYYLHYMTFGMLEGRIATGDITYRGIDVSYHQGAINWPAVKNAGIDFAMIRAGYGREAGQEDKCFAYNIQEARKAGIKVGVYHYSYADSVGRAIDEANYLLSIIRPYGQLDLPVAFDFEESSRRQTGLKAENTAIIQAFCDTIRAAGYTPMLYTYYNMLVNYIDYNGVKQYDLWVARYASSLNYQNPVAMWQYTSTGTVDGIAGSVDLDISYIAY